MASSPVSLRGLRSSTWPLHLVKECGLTAAVAAGIFWLGYDGGTYSATSRHTVAIAVWWSIIVGIAFGVWPRSRPRNAALVGGWLLAAFAVWTFCSLLWTTSAERTFDEFTRVTLYIGLFAVAVLGSTRSNLGRWANGLALGITAIATLALASRFFPHVVSAEDAIGFLPGARSRLSYPLGYWNALAILAGLGIPLLIRAAVARPGSIVPGAALVPIPALVGVIYLASSRGGVVAAAVGTLVLLLLAARRWAVAWAMIVAGAGSAAAIAVLLARADLVDRPNLEHAASQGRSAALLFALIGVGTGAVFTFSERAVSPRIRVGPGVGKVAAATAVAVALVAALAAHPVRRFHDFTSVPTGGQATPRSAIQSHLVSINGNGRWQYWGAAYAEFKTEPVRGRGAGSFEAWWARRGTLAGFVRDAHSLYAETLGELGLVGLALLLAALCAPLAAAVAGVRLLEGEDRTTLAALIGAFAGFAVAAAGDWMWEMTVVGAVGIVALGLAAGPAIALNRREGVRAKGLRHGYGISVALILAAWVFILANGIPLLTDLELRKSESAVARGDGAAALGAARSARDLQPWAASPYLQLALVGEQTGLLRPARRWIEQAIDRDSTDWRLPLVAARIDVKLGLIQAARRQVDRAARLNPRSPLFATLTKRQN